MKRSRTQRGLRKQRPPEITCVMCRGDIEPTIQFLGHTYSLLRAGISKRDRRVVNATYKRIT